MRRRFWLSALLALGVALAASLYSQYRPADAPTLAADMPSGTSFLVLLGVGDKAATAWDGTVSVTGATITGIQGWRFGAKDSVDNRSGRKLSTRVSSASAAPMMENGIIITANLTDPAAQFKIITTQGEFPNDGPR